MGPTVIFDKSALQALSVDESVWLDNFFNTNLTPLFWVETLADLEKAPSRREKRTAVEIVQNLAEKTPDMCSKVNMHHETLLAAELIEGYQIDLTAHRPIISGGHWTELEKGKGIVFRPSDEEVAFSRWQDGAFLNLERSIAKQWRQKLSIINFASLYKQFRGLLEASHKPRNLVDGKWLADQILDYEDQESALLFAMSLLNVTDDFQQHVYGRWQKAGRPSLQQFAPYFRYIASVDLTFYFELACDRINRERTSHKIDLAYLYYLPFCSVFTSGDKLHWLLAPMFLQQNQGLIKSTDLKAALAAINTYYKALPDAIKQQGVYKFAQHPPLACDTLITELWDTYLPNWRHSLSHHYSPKSETPPPEDEPIAQWQDGLVSMVIERSVTVHKGSWTRFPPQVTSNLH